MDFFIMFIKSIGALVVVLGLLIITLRIAGNGLSQGSSNKYTKIIDKTQVSKDSFIVVVKIGKKGVVLSTSNGSTEKLYELSEEEVSLIEKERQESLDAMSIKYKNLIVDIKGKGSSLINKIRPKEDNHE